ncbi:MAG TPA: ABC transporter substrate-binding protein [Streptosporangiaceae bacterium]|nr:ABC transporter substrate-binding protein [Streptosporangiaceae bacterium]
MTAARRGRRRSALLIGAAAVLSGAVAACGSSSSSTTAAGGTALTSTTVLLDWFPNPDHIALYLAQKDGDFAAQHLAVTFQSPSNSTDALKLVSLGQVPLAISYEPETITAATDNLDVTAVAALIPTPLNSLIISGKSGISSPGQLAGKTVGTDGDPVSAAIFKVVLKKYGLSLAQTKLVTVNEGLVPAIVSGKVSAIISGYRNVEAIQLASLGLKPKVYPVNTQGVPNYDELVVIANKHKLASDAAYAAMVRKFLAGLAKGAAAAQASPSAALAALSPVAKGYSPALLKKMVYATAPLLANSAGFGAMDMSSWQSFADWMKSEGLISKPVQASSVVNTSLLPKS